MLTVKFEKNRKFDATAVEWAEFAAGLQHKRFVQFHAASYGDTVHLDTNQEIWSIRERGDNMVFNFEKIDDYTLRVIVKWLLFKMLSSYATSTSHMLFKIIISHGWTIDDLMLPAVYKKMELCSREKDGYGIRGFSLIKRLADFLISNGAPATDIEDLFELEQLTPNLSKEVMGYYHMEVRLSPLEDQFIRTKSTHDASFMERLSYKEIRDFVVLKLCYEVGFRPIQLFRLAQDDFRSVGDQYFSIRRPLAKKGKVNDGKVGTDQLSISPELGRVIKELIERQNNHSVQLLQRENGSEFRSVASIASINRTLSRWGIKDSHKTPYDFRHNMAHRMVSAGSSASEIAYMLGHNNFIAAKHYIAASPSISALREKALARNGTYGSIVALLTGDITLPGKWQGENVLGRVGDELATGIGGCDAADCEYVPVYNCYGCQDFHPFSDGNHDIVLASLRGEVSKVIAISDSTRQSGMNPAMTQLEGVMEQVKAVMSRCRTCRGGHHAK